MCKVIRVFLKNLNSGRSLLISSALNLVIVLHFNEAYIDDTLKLIELDSKVIDIRVGSLAHIGQRRYLLKHLLLQNVLLEHLILHFLELTQDEFLKFVLLVLDTCELLNLRCKLT